MTAGSIDYTPRPSRRGFHSLSETQRRFGPRPGRGAIQPPGWRKPAAVSDARLYEFSAQRKLPLCASQMGPKNRDPCAARNQGSGLSEALCECPLWVESGQSDTRKLSEGRIWGRGLTSQCPLSVKSRRQLTYYLDQVEGTPSSV